MAAAVVCFISCACDPVRSFEGRVQSAHRGTSEAPRPLPQAKVSERCKHNESVLAYSDSSGRVEGGGLGWWSADCPLKITDPNGEHAPHELDVRKLCKGEASCPRLDFEVVLERTGAAFGLREVNVRYSAAPRDLVLYTHNGGEDRVVCRGPCVTTLPAGEHLLRLGLPEASPLRPSVVQARPLPQSWEGVPVRLDRDTSLEGILEVNETAMWIGGVLTAVGTIGIYTALYGVWKEEATTTWVGAGMAAGGVGIGLPLLYVGLPRASLKAVETGRRESQRAAGR